MRMKLSVFALFCAVTMVGCNGVTGPSDERKLGNPEFKLPNPIICASPSPNTWSPFPENLGKCPPVR